MPVWRWLYSDVPQDGSANRTLGPQIAALQLASFAVGRTAAVIGLLEGAMGLGHGHSYQV
jgi:hypothetical protein